MKIYSNGQDRVLTGNFPQRFRLLNAGIDVPFIRTSPTSIRLSGEVPTGDLDILEVIKEQSTKRPALTTDAKFVMMNANEADRLEKLGGILEEKSGLLESKAKELEQSGKDIVSWENKNAEKIAQTDASIEEMAKVFGKEIQADRESVKATVSKIKNLLSETAEVLDAKIQAHELAKNPHKINKSSVGLDAVDNTSDADKPISKAVKKALDKKADKEDLEEVKEKIEDAGKKQESLLKSFDNMNLYGGVGGGAGSGVPDGGTTGQVLTKKSDLNGDVEWATSSGIGLNIDGGRADSIYTDQQIIDGGNV